MGKRNKRARTLLKRMSILGEVPSLETARRFGIQNEVQIELDRHQAIIDEQERVKAEAEEKRLAEEKAAKAAEEKRLAEEKARKEAKAKAEADKKRKAEEAKKKKAPAAKKKTTKAKKDSED